MRRELQVVPCPPPTTTSPTASTCRDQRFHWRGAAAGWNDPHGDLAPGAAAAALAFTMLREAAVLALVYRRRDGELMVRLVRRARGGAHGGQLALPGGHREPADADWPLPPCGRPTRSSAWSATGSSSWPPCRWWRPRPPGSGSPRSRPGSPRRCPGAFSSGRWPRCWSAGGRPGPARGGRRGGP